MVFQISPTGFGKSLIFQLLLPHLLKDKNVLVLDMTPYLSIIKDQVEELTRLGLHVMTPLHCRRFHAGVQQQQQRQKYTSHKPQIISVVKGAFFHLFRFTRLVNRGQEAN